VKQNTLRLTSLLPIMMSRRASWTQGTRLVAAHTAKALAPNVSRGHGTPAEKMPASVTFILPRLTLMRRPIA